MLQYPKISFFYRISLKTPFSRLFQLIVESVIQLSGIVDAVEAKKRTKYFTIKMLFST